MNRIQSRNWKKFKEEVDQTSMQTRDDVIICRCEEITRGNILKVIREGADTLNIIKRITRAGMGLCQGRTCQKMIAVMIAQELGKSLSEVAPPSVRPPLRPTSMKVFCGDDR